MHLFINLSTTNTPTSAIGLDQGRLRQGSNLLIEELLSLLPDTRVGSVIKCEKARQKSFTEHLRALTGKEGGEMINADHAQGQGPILKPGDGDCRFIKCGRNVVQRNGVQGVGALKISHALASVVHIMTHVSALTSQMTERVRSGAESDSKLTKANGRKCQPVEAI